MAAGEGAEGRVINPEPIVDSDVLERVITQVGETLVDAELPRDDRIAVWKLLRSLIAMRSKERVAQMERAIGIRK